MGRRGYPAELRRKVLDLLADGRSVARNAHDLERSATRRSTAGVVRLRSAHSDFEKALTAAVLDSPESHW